MNRSGASYIASSKSVRLRRLFCYFYWRCQPDRATGMKCSDEHPLVEYCNSQGNITEVYCERYSKGHVLLTVFRN